MRFIQPRSFLRSTDSCSADRISCRTFSHWPPQTALPLPITLASRAGAGRHSQPVPVPGPGPARPGTGRPGPARTGPQRDKPGYGVTVASPGDVTRDVIIVRLAPYPIIFHSSESAGVLGPLRVCKDLRALTHRSTRSDRFTAMRVQTREAHWRRGLAQPPSLERALVVEELRARVRIISLVGKQSKKIQQIIICKYNPNQQII